jgi:TPR repeat protein
MECWSRTRRVAATVALLIVAAAFCLDVGTCRAATPQPAPEGTAAVPAAPSAEVTPDPAPELSFFQWMEKARAGDVEAQCNVGVMYVNGQGVPRDYKEGVEWLYKAGNLGFAHAQFLLAGLYSQGFGSTPADPFKTWFWASLAAANTGLPDAERQRAVKMMTAGEKSLSAQHLASAQKMAKDWWEGRAAAPR